MSTAIIDIDTYLYKASLACSDLVELEPELYYEAYNLNKARLFLKEIADTIPTQVGCNEYIFVTGGVGKNFRYVINPDYKSNRKNISRPIMLEKVRELAFKEFPMVYTPHLEADDTCRILLEENKDNVVVSVDKDLRTFSGKIYDSYHGVMRYITKEQAEVNFKRQLLIGDKTDGYGGIPKIGPATADKLLLGGITEDEILEMYLEKGLSVDDFKRTYNCAKIIGKNDFKEGVITLYGGEKLDTRKIGD